MAGAVLVGSVHPSPSRRLPRVARRQDPLNLLGDPPDADRGDSVCPSPEPLQAQTRRSLKDPLGLDAKRRKRKPKRKSSEIAKGSNEVAHEAAAETDRSESASPPKRKQTKRFQFGNYNRYYGYRRPEEDPRMSLLQTEWFREKEVLDIGCNTGVLTISIARQFSPRLVVGMDIDGSLIHRARRGLLLAKDEDKAFPESLSKTYGDLSVPSLPQPGSFPGNVLFTQGNFVLDSDQRLTACTPRYDVILAMSVTKWVHLNWGDDGLKRFFQRAFRELRPGGRFILEPQPFASYKRRKKLSEEIFANYQQIRFRPEQFREYLLSREVGYSTCQLVGVSTHSSKGFRRPVFVYTKSDVPR